MELQQGENVIWTGRPSWRSIMSYEFTFLGVDRPGQLRDRISHAYGARVEELEGEANRDPQGV